MTKAGIAKNLLSNMLAVDVYVYQPGQSGLDPEIMRNPANVSIVLGSELVGKQVRTIAEAIYGVPGVTTHAQIGANNEASITLRGMTPTMVLILVDGMRVNLSNSSNAGRIPMARQVQTAYLPPLGIIERIEVIKGPASIIYGGDAVGGVINIITKKDVTKQAKGGGGIYATFQEQEQFANQYAADFYVTYPLMGNLILNVSGREQFRKGAQPKFLKKHKNNLNPSEIIGGPMANFSQINTRISMIIAETSEFYGNANVATQVYDNEHKVYGDRNDNTLVLNRINLSGGYNGSYDIRNSPLRFFGDNIRVDGYYQTIWANASGYRINGKERERYGVDTVMQGRASLSNWLHYTLLGAKISYASINDKMMKESLTRKGMDLFVSTNLRVLSLLVINVGMRVAYESDFGPNYSTKLYAMCNPLTDLIIKLGAMRGYQSIAIDNITSEHIGYTTDQSELYGNPMAKRLLPHNYEISVEYDNKMVQAGVAAYFNQINNWYRLETLNQSKEKSKVGSKKKYYDNNIDVNYFGAEAYIGGNVSLDEYGEIEAQTSYSYAKNTVTKSPDKEEVGHPIRVVPEHGLTAVLKYSIYNYNVFMEQEVAAKILRIKTKNMSAKLRGIDEYYGNVYQMNLGIGYVFNNFRFSMAVHNVTGVDFYLFRRYQETASSENKKDNYKKAGDYNFAREGRRYYLAVNYDF